MRTAEIVIVAGFVVFGLLGFIVVVADELRRWWSK
jgi:preprotein translocase subunit Sss1